MTTYPTLKITKGARSIDLNDRVNFYLRTDFVPPETSQATQIATGSALNVSGGRVVARKPQTRTWSFSVRVVGATDADIISQLRGVKALLSLAGDANEPVKIQYSPNSDTPEPLWGQFGALLNYEVLDGSITIGPDYMRGARRTKAVIATFSLTIQPYAIGKQQRVCTAGGGVIEDTIGMADGRSRGVIMPEATTNLCTNPVFGNATWNTGWTAGASIIETKINDSAYLLPYTMVSAKLTATAAANNTYTQSLTLAAVAHTIWVLIRLPDGGTPSSTHMQMYYNGAAVTTTFTSSGNGLWTAEAAVTGTAGATTCGVVVKSAYTIYLLAMQAEAKAYRTPLCYGDMLGCAWTGTAHASSSTRTAANLKLSLTNNPFPMSQGTLRLAVKWPVSNTHPNQMQFFDVRDAGALTTMRAYFNPAGDSFGMTDHFAPISSAAQTIAVGETMILHFVWGPGRLAIYKNGVSVASGASFTPSVTGAALTIGNSYAAGAESLCTFMGVGLFDVALSDTQIANDAANAAAVLADGARLESVPWLWTKDGDNVVDNCNDSTRDNWCVVGGVSGTAEAETLLDVTVSGYDTAVLIGLNAVEKWVDPGSYLYSDFSGSADANSSGGAYKSGTIDTSGLVPFTVLTIQDNLLRFLAFSGREFFPLLRIYDVGASAVNYRWRPYGAAGYEFTNSQTLSAAWQMARLLPFRTLSKKDVFGDVTGENVTISLVPKRATGSADIWLDYVMLMPKPTISIAYPFSAAGPSLLIQGLNVVEYLPAFSNRFMIPKPAVTGDSVELVPELLNTLIVNVGATITNTVTFNSIKVKPRWQLV